MVISPALVRPQAHTHCPDRARRADSGAGGGATAPRGGVLSFEAKESTKESQRHGDSRDGPRRCAPWASVCGSRTVGCPEFIRGIQFRPKGRNSLTTFRGQTALRGCPRARGVRCRIAPYRSLCSPPTLPAGRFGLRPRPHWGHASLRDSSLRSPFREKALYCPFLKEGVRNVARRPVSEITHTFVRARAHSFPLSKRARLFPSAAYRRSAPPQSAVGILTPCEAGCFNAACKFL